MQKNIKKFFLYARKSTEWDERQVQSLDDQVNIMKKKAQSLWINIVEIFQESMSAKAPWRYKFNEMIARIHAWEAEWIIAWKLDRLSRNPIDSGSIQYMLQTWALNQVITNDREYTSEDAGLLMSVENGMSNQFILDLKKNVIRWMNSKTEKWIFCWQAPEWYLNNRLEKTIEVDEQNFPLIRKAWDLMLSWNYTVPIIVDMMNSDYGYKSNKKWRDKITLSWLYGIYKNLFYTGNFMWKWEVKIGTHKPMISLWEYNLVQEILWRKWTKIRPKTHEFSFTGIIQCWGCEWSIVATEKTKKILTTGEYKTYTYYHCSKRKKGCKCNQKRVRLEDLELQIESLLWSIEIIPAFKDLAIEILKSNYKQEIDTQEKIRNNLNTSVQSSEKKLERLLDLLIDGKIEDTIYRSKKESIQQEILTQRGNLKKYEDGSLEVFEKTEDIFHFITLAKEKFNNGSIQDKKTILSKLGKNFILLDGELILDMHSWFQPLQKQLPRIRKEYKAWELTKKGSSSWILEPDSSLISLWSGGRGLNSHTRGLKPQYTHSIMLPPQKISKMSI